MNVRVGGVNIIAFQEQLHPTDGKSQIVPGDPRSEAGQAVDIRAASWRISVRDR